MSRRRTLRDELLAHGKTLGLSAALIDQWRGDPLEYNPDGPTPGVFFSYAGTAPGKLMKALPQLHDRTVHFAVLVETDDRTAPKGDGEGQALDLLEAVEEGLSGWRPTIGGVCEPAGTEQLIDAAFGRYLYGQKYQIRLT